MLDNVIDNMVNALDTDDLIILAKRLGTFDQLPVTDDMWPDWSDDLAVKTAEELSKCIKEY